MVSVHVLSLNPAKINCGIITGIRSSLVVDGGPGPSSGRELMRRALELRESADEPGTKTAESTGAIDVAVTHDHWDHFFGTAALVSAGAQTVYASKSFAGDQEATAWIALDSVRQETGTEDYRAELPADPNDLIVSVTAVDEVAGATTSVDLGDCPVEFHVLGGHSTADLIVRLPELGVVFTGDLVEEDDPPQAGADASLSEWAQSLRTLLSFPETTIFVPGHGVPVDREFVERQLEDIEGLRQKQGEGDVALPARTRPEPADRTIPREIRLI